MLGGAIYADGFHGNDGMGDFEEEDQASIDLLQKEHAVQALTRLVRENAGSVLPTIHSARTRIQGGQIAKTTEFKISLCRS